MSQAGRRPLFAAHSDTDFLYGVNPAFEVLRAGRRAIQGVWLNCNATHLRLKKLAEALERAGHSIQWVEKGRLNDLIGSTEHQGVVLEVAPYPYSALDEVLADSRLLLLDNVEDPQNVGAILRSAEVFGWRHICLPCKGVPLIYPSVVKASAGATEYLHVCREALSSTYVERAKAAGFFVVALDMGGKTSLESMQDRRSGKILLVIGGEDRAVGHYLLQQAGAVVALHQTGQVNSLNASVAAGIALYSLAPLP